MTAPLTGYSNDFPNDVLIDSGVLYVGANKFGAFAGGLKFDPGVTYRNIDFDGKRSPLKGLDLKASMAPKISGTCIVLNPLNVPQIDPGADSSTGAGIPAAGGSTYAATSYAPQRAGSLLVTGDYLTDVRAIWLRGNGKFVQVYFKSGLCTKYDMTSQDGQEVAIALEIEARLPFGDTGYTNVGDAPYRIEYLDAV
jgi:hypothetical protein